ncbi:HET-domain-containing protein [Cubamyces sp. BRFM 1775]|nr:HET-domain-containing protein [Cubamyces sp. BRFM 1775]
MTITSMDLPSKPPSICASAWEGVFAAHFGLTSDPIGRDWHPRWGLNRLPRDEWTGGYSYTVSASALLKCARTNCLWCGLLVKNCVNEDLLRRRSFLWPFDRIDVQVGTNTGSGKPLGLFIRLSHKLGDPQWFSMYTAEDDPAARWIDRRTRLPNIGAPHVLALAKSCVEQCVHNHPRCQEAIPHANEPASLPTRLIDCSDSDCLRILETNSHTPPEPYVAISYVWGGEQPHRTTMANLARYMVRLDNRDLPQTIRDAVRVTRALGVRFLWMDSLCIIQDCKEDMYRELARMRDVYRYAYVTIDAASSSSVKDGFLQDRRPLNANAMLPFICPREPTGQSAGKTARTGMVYLVNDGDNTVDQRDVLTHGDGHDSGYTGGRGWCLQEALLSTRSLVFTSETLQLRCYTETCNVGGAKHDDERSLPRLPDATLLHDAKVHVERDSDEWKDIYSRWWNIIRDYSGRSLTNPSDKLTAFAGLAQMFAPALGPDYLAGLWRSSLLTDLLWWRNRGTTNASAVRHPEKYRAPSWSWASVDGPLSSTSVSGRALAEVVACSVSLQSEILPFGQVTGGSIVLRAMLFPCEWAGFHRFEGRLTMSVKLMQGAECTVLGGLQSRSLPPDTHARIDCDDDLALQQMWFVPLYHQIAVHGLVVTRAESNTWESARSEGSNETYRRVAYGNISLGRFTSRILDTVAPYPTSEIELV